MWTRAVRLGFGLGRVETLRGQVWVLDLAEIHTVDPAELPIRDLSGGSLLADAVSGA